MQEAESGEGKGGEVRGCQATVEQKGLRDRDGGFLFRTGAKRGVAQEEGGRARFINQRLKGPYRDGGGSRRYIIL
jgi:hypothetical protein